MSGSCWPLGKHRGEGSSPTFLPASGDGFSPSGTAVLLPWGPRAVPSRCPHWDQTPPPPGVIFFPSFLFAAFPDPKPAAPSLPEVVNHLGDENSCDNGGAARGVPPRREPMARLDNGVGCVTPRGGDTERRWRGQRRAPALCSLGLPGSAHRSPPAAPWRGTAGVPARPRSLPRSFEDGAIWLNLGLSGLASCVDGATCGWLSPFGDAACVLGLGGIPKATCVPFFSRYFPCARRCKAQRCCMFWEERVFFFFSPLSGCCWPPR